MLHRRLARRVERVVGDVVDGADDPAVVPEVEHVDARGRLLEGAEVGAVAGEGVGDDDPVDAAVEDAERRVPLARDEPVERGMDPVERLAERLAAEKACVLVGDAESADEERLELLGREGVEPAAAPLGELGPALDLVSGRDDRRRLRGARQVARDDEVELDAGKRLARGRGLLEPALGERYALRVHRPARLVHVRDVGVPHQVQPASHSYLARCRGFETRSFCATCSFRSATAFSGTSPARIRRASSQSSPSRGGRGRPELALGDPEPVDRDERPELQPVVVEDREDLLLQELAHGLRELLRGRAVMLHVRSDPAARTPSRRRGGRAPRAPPSAPGR